MFDSFAPRRGAPKPRDLTARRGRPSGTVPAIDRNFLHAADRDPHVTGRDASRQRLLGRAVTQLYDDRVAQQDPSEVAELVGDGAGELTELQE